MTHKEGNIIHPTAIIYPGVTMGIGNIIGPYCIIGAPPEWKGKEYQEGRVIIGNNNRFTGLVTIDSGGVGLTVIGDNCYFMKHSHVGHDAHINDGVTISCGAKVGGHTIIGEGCNLGLNSVIHQRQIIQPNCMIGALAMVTKKLITAGGRKYAGVPARDIGENIKK